MDFKKILVIYETLLFKTNFDQTCGVYGKYLLLMVVKE